MSRNSSLYRLIGFGTWLTLVALALTFLLRWRGNAVAQKADHLRGPTNSVGGD
jgi:hypothetical protein